jgi:predicted nucleotidyltransferase
MEAQMAGPVGVVDRARLKAVADCLRERYGAQRVILFGSAARGDASEHSDNDLLVIAETREKLYTRMATVLSVVRELSRGMPLSPVVLTPEELSARLARGDQLAQEIVQAGVDL